MDKLRTLLQPAPPLSAKVFGWILVLTGLFFAWVFMAAPGFVFPGIVIETRSEMFGLYSTGVRVLGSVLGIVIALVLDSAALLLLMLVTRIFIELGDIVVGLVVNGAPDANTVSLMAVAAVESVFAVILLRRLMAGR